MSEHQFKNIVMGGTFSQLHNGHLHLLSTANSIARTISIGLTSTEYLKKYPKKFPDMIFPYSFRLNQLIKYITKININSHFYIFPIDHPWQNFSVESPSLDSIIVSEETSSTADKINKIREENNLKPLKSIIISGVVSNSGNYLSSTAIREKSKEK